MVGRYYDGFLSELPPEEASGKYMNYGYWQADTDDNATASNNLVDLLVSGISNRRGLVLDVACGTGATTRRMSLYWDPQQIVGINISRRQLSECKRLLPTSTFSVMDAAHIAACA